MIHASKLFALMDERDGKGNRKPFSFKFRKVSTGEVVEATNVTLLKYYHRQGYFNIQWPNGEIRSIDYVSIIEIKGVEVAL